MCDSHEPTPLSKLSSLSRRGALAAVGGTLAAAWLRPTYAQQQPQMAQVGNSLYVWTNSGYTSYFIVTSAGVIVGDPSGGVNPNNPAMFKAAIEEVTDLPVRYVIYTHAAGDHSPGGAIFADTAEFVAHENSVARFQTMDLPNTPLPTITFAEHMSLALGDKQIELYYPGRTQEADYLVMHYPEESAATLVDIAENKRLPFRSLGGGFVDEWIESLRWIETNLDFAWHVTGHTHLGTKDNVAIMRGYLEDLVASVLAARDAGLEDNSEEMVNFVRAALNESYGDWLNFGPQLSDNIQGVINWLNR